MMKTVGHLLCPLFCGLLIGCAAPSSSGPVKASASARAIGDDDAFWDNLWSDVDGAENDPTIQREATIGRTSYAPDPGGIATVPGATAPGAVTFAPSSAPAAATTSRPAPVASTGIDPVEIAPGVNLPSRFPDALNALRSVGYEILGSEQDFSITAEKIERLEGEEAVTYLLGRGVTDADPAVSGRPAASREVTITTRRAFQFADGVFNGGHRVETRYEWR